MDTRMEIGQEGSKGKGKASSGGRQREVTAKMVAANRANLRLANRVEAGTRYRLTPRRLAACRANLAKANAVDRSIRCRPTEKRLAACQANLLKAQARQRGSGRPPTGSVFDTGCTPPRWSGARRWRGRAG